MKIYLNVIKSFLCYNKKSSLPETKHIKDALIQVPICLEYNPPTNSSISSSSLPSLCLPTHFYCRKSLIPPCSFTLKCMHNAATLMLHMWWSPLCKDLPTFFWYAVKIIQESASGAGQNKLHFSLHSVWNAACLVMPVSLVGKSKFYQNSDWQHRQVSC